MPKTITLEEFEKIQKEEIHQRILDNMLKKNEQAAKIVRMKRAVKTAKKKKLLTNLGFAQINWSVFKIFKRR